MHLPLTIYDYLFTLNDYLYYRPLLLLPITEREIRTDHQQTYGAPLHHQFVSIRLFTITWYLSNLLLLRRRLPLALKETARPNALTP